MHTSIREYSKPKTKEAGAREMIYHFDEIKQLKKELFKVTQERDLLKKAAAYFAREFK